VEENSIEREIVASKKITGGREMAVRLLSYGSYGDDVKKLQAALNACGYGLDVDGGYGTKTRAAVVDYQKKNNLQVDGTVGNETWGSLANNQKNSVSTTYGSSKSVLAGVSEETANTLAGLEQGRIPSDETTAAQANYVSVLDEKPKDFTSSYQEQLAQLYAEMENREPFSYDPEADTTYRQYRDTYVRQGRTAMEDTSGKAAALTGGYASSYAQTAGQQTYQSYLQQLYDLIPDLQQNAEQRYAAAGEAIQDRYQLLQGQEKTEYDRWRDTVSDWQDEADRAQKTATAAKDSDDSLYKTMLNYYADKASAEQKAATVNGVTSRNNSGAAAAGGAAAFSSVAYTSLAGAMSNYLKGGNLAAARSLFEQYRGRMTNTQKQSAATLFQKYGQTV
jgi:peptidoglycan hydrolase-like protein with peptidoglycan-binding domain